MNTPYTLRHFRWALTAFFGTLCAGTILFALVLHESAFQSFYRSTVTVSLTGIDTKPQNTSGEVVTILLIFAGMAIYGYLASAIVELIAHGVLTGTVSERRRTRVIEMISDHYIMCGFGRVGREVADEFRDAGVPFVVLDFNPEVLEIARQQNIPYIEGSGTKDEDLDARRPRTGRGLVACADSDVDNLYIVVSARADAAGPPDRRARLERGCRREDAPGGRRPRRAAVRLRGPGDGEVDAEAVGVGVPGHRLPRTEGLTCGSRRSRSRASAPRRDGRSGMCGSGTRRAR